jgi:hypothetical protein
MSALRRHCLPEEDARIDVFGPVVENNLGKIMDAYWFPFNLAKLDLNTRIGSERQQLQ